MLSWSEIGVEAVAVASFYSLWWCRSLSRRLHHTERLSKLDPLTGLGSGSWLDAERWPAALRSGRALGVLHLDLDHLKLRNDLYGHGVGDQYIQTAAEQIVKALRRGVDEVFRLHTAGDEFVVLLHGPILDLESFGWSLLERLRERGVMASYGLALTTATAFEPSRVNLRVVAEAACRKAKQRGGNCGVYALELDVHGEPNVGRCFQGTRPSPSPDAANVAGLSAETSCIPELVDDSVTQRMSAELHGQLLRQMAQPAGRAP